MAGGQFYSDAAKAVARFTGHPIVFLMAIGSIVVWLISGPIFGFSDTWQLVINTGTTIITFLMVFLIQNTQNRDTMAIQLKLDELIRATEGAHISLLDLEELSEEKLAQFRDQYEALAAKAREMLAQGKTDTGIPDALLDAMPGDLRRPNAD
jgi:low affinity Fe/Cu permease